MRRFFALPVVAALLFSSVAWSQEIIWEVADCRMGDFYGMYGFSGGGATISAQNVPGNLTTTQICNANGAVAFSVPNPNPNYATAGWGFDWTAISTGTRDLSGIQGIAVTYSLTGTGAVNLVIRSTATSSDSGTHYQVVLPSQSMGPRQFTTFAQPAWVATQPGTPLAVDRGRAFSNSTGIRFETNTAGTNANLTIQKIEWIGPTPPSDIPKSAAVDKNKPLLNVANKTANILGGWIGDLDGHEKTTIIPRVTGGFQNELFKDDGFVNFYLEDGGSNRFATLGLFWLDRGIPATNVSSTDAVTIRYSMEVYEGDPTVSLRIRPAKYSITTGNNPAAVLPAGRDMVRTFNFNASTFTQNNSNLAAVLANAAGLEFHVAGIGGVDLVLDRIEWGAGSNIRFHGSKAQSGASAIRASYSKGTIGVNWDAGTRLSGGTVSLVNTKGVTVASSQVKAGGGNVTAKLGAGKIPTGMYFVRINAKDMNGGTIVRQVPVSIVK